MITAPATADPDTLAAILVLVSAIERRADTDAAVLGFRAALARRGREFADAGGPAALDALARAVADIDPGRVDARLALLRGAWGELLPAPDGRVRA